MAATGVRHFLAAAALLGLLSGAAAAAEAPALEHRLDLPGGAAVLLLASPEWDGSAAPRAVVVVHGLGRNVSGYYRALARARAIAGAEAILVAPHFLADEDRPASDLLRWGRGAWMGGAPARGPTAASAFDVLDALLTRLADRARYPGLREVVVVGHSAGAQLVQRYVAVGHGVPVGLPVRYVIANPSSYLWFGPDRPGTDGAPAPFAATAACPGYNAWKYGLAGGLPPYVTEPPATLEARYISREVAYLIGGEDTDPQERDLDRSCGGMAQGPNRFARNVGFLAHLAARHGGLANQTRHVVPGVAHAGARMIESPCGVATLFGVGRCE